jgi:hypothetical protein
MNFRNLKNTVAALALGAVAAYPAATAKADDTAAEIRLLKERLKQLEAKVAKQERERKEAEAKLAKVSPAAAGPPILAQQQAYVPVTMQQPVYDIPKIPGSTDQRPLVVPAPVSLGAPAQPPSYETGGLAGLQANLQGYPYIGPSSLFVNNVSITPGGFFELASIARNHFIGADVATPWQNIPFPFEPTYHTGEFHFSARRSRLAALVRGDVDPATHLSGFGEFDFLGAAQTANLNQTDSFNFRIRHLYLALDNDDWGVHLLAGHTFTLATMDIIGILPREENTPMTIEDQYVPGFVWDRQDQLRIVKDFDQKLWFALSLEQPQTTFGGVVPTAPIVTNQLPAAVPAPGATTNDGQGIVGGSLFNSSNALSLNQMPDIIGKVAWDPTIADRTIHTEFFGIYRNFIDTVSVCPGAPFTPAGCTTTVASPGFAGFIDHTNTVSGGGLGGSILVPIVPKVLEGQFSGAVGRGIGRYGAAQLPDATVNANGSPFPIPETMFLAGLIWHAMHGLDLYVYAGQEKESPAWGYTALGTNNFVGYGNPFYNNSGCEIEYASPTTCVGNTSTVRQITGGFWDDIFRGPFGRLTWGLQYSYTQKVGFPGEGYTPKVDESMFFGSIRYYPF